MESIRPAFFLTVAHLTRKPIDIAIAIGSKTPILAIQRSASIRQGSQTGPGWTWERSAAWVVHIDVFFFFYVEICLGKKMWWHFM